MRIVSICPSNTEVVGYLGKEDMLVAVDDYSNWPDRVADLPRVGPDLTIDMDKVESLRPDLVLASLSVPGMEKNVYELNKRNIPHIVLNPNTLEDIACDIETVAEALHCKETGSEKARAFRESVSRYRKFSEQKDEKPSLYWEWWPKPVFTPGGANWLTEISELAGAYNIFATEPEANVQTDWEEVRKRNPDHICLVWVGVKEEKVNPHLLLKRPGWEKMKAVQNQSVHVLGDSLYCRPSPRLLLGLDKLMNTLWGQSPPR
ncbi:cobalamin-binding protein [Siminovitchia sp. FSL H7-0308]|jgi:iron complex transport system substrate-binding protein|uniref:Iron complex transport system substrate-binding protein n=1 Tax=Siminovitchia thermophila TaxID=1245522 RepID=A0ABS2R5E9_9BACI|nr:cobalamin-binding protein [Siminovitchia thermophila]MBM7714394.1 iron complex transport system substrate-binding protein [Siminovitchia thermophila]ONK25057.1 cobalamin-binding protein [Bacillus sp. VT-16-64]